MLDGIRTPSSPAACLPTRLTLTADSPHTLVARYLPETLDSDGNGLQDWWERKYFGLVGCSPKADPDGDGYTLAEELAAWTNPLIPEDIPRPPAITFTPFSETLATPAPYTLEATLTDPREIQTAMIEWQAVNGADPSWNHTPLLPQETPVSGSQTGMRRNWRKGLLRRQPPDTAHLAVIRHRRVDENE